MDIRQIVSSKQKAVMLHIFVYQYWFTENVANTTSENLETFQRTKRKFMLNKVSQYCSEKDNIEDLSPEQAQECCKMLKAITLVIVSKIDDKSKFLKGQCS